MNSFLFERLEIEGLVLITPFYSEDERGGFLKYYEKDIFAENGIIFSLNECFETSSHKDVIRGLHFQLREPQDKLIRVVSGEVFDVAVDLRKESPFFGKWMGVNLSSENRKSFFVPKGFAHGFLVKSENAVVSYSCGGRYMREYDSGIRWDDGVIDINWGVDNPIVSQKDQNLMTLEEFQRQGLEF